VKRGRRIVEGPAVVVERHLAQVVASGLMSKESVLTESRKTQWVFGETTAESGGVEHAQVRLHVDVVGHVVALINQLPGRAGRGDVGRERARNSMIDPRRRSLWRFSSLTMLPPGHLHPRRRLPEPHRRRQRGEDRRGLLAARLHAQLRIVLRSGWPHGAFGQSMDSLLT
jgi:hypothetical protein